MSWLTKFKTNPLNLLGPNIDKTAIQKIDLSGTVLSFKCPPQTAEIPGFTGDNQFDIDKDPVLEEGVGSKNILSLNIFNSGWSFDDRIFNGSSYGGVNCRFILLKNKTKQNRTTKSHYLIKQPWKHGY